jgi:hypothetical protein
LLGIVSGSESQILLFFRSAVRDSNQVRFESEVVLLPVLLVKKIVRSIFLLSPGDFFFREIENCYFRKKRGKIEFVRDSAMAAVFGLGNRRLLLT